MRKLISLVFICLTLLNAQMWAQDWYADSGSGDMVTRGWHATANGVSCTTGSGAALTWASRAAGDVFHANGCTSISITSATTGDPGANGKVTLSTVAGGTGGGIAGGGFTCTTNSGPANLTVDITAGTSTVLNTAGSSGSGCNIAGGGTITAGSGANGVSDAHTVVALTVAANLVGGTSGNASGYSFSGATGSVAVTGNATAGANTTGGFGLNVSSTGTATIAGNCIGNDTSSASVGCNASSTGTITVTGKLIWGKRSGPANGTIIWTPAATDYTLAAKDGSYTTGTVDTHATEAPADPGASNVKNGLAYGSFTGTLASGGNSGSAH